MINTVATTDGNNCSVLAKPDIIESANCIPNIECIIAKISGNMKNIPIPSWWKCCH